MGDVLELGSWKMWVPRDDWGDDGAGAGGEEAGVAPARDDEGEDEETSEKPMTVEEWEAQEWVPLRPSSASRRNRAEWEEVGDAGPGGRDVEEAWRRWEQGRHEEEALAADPFQKEKPLAYWGWKAHQRRHMRRARRIGEPSRTASVDTSSPGCLVLENAALSCGYLPTCELQLPGGAAGGGFVYVSHAGDAVVFNASTGQLSMHTAFDALRARRACEVGVRERVQRPPRPPPPPWRAAPEAGDVCP